MVSKEFISYIANKTGIKRKELIEKDILLQYLLKELQKDSYFRNNFVFKGGTCLVKCYLGYYRFSEDLDFSWIKQDIFLNKSEKQIRKILSEEINKIINLLKEISKKLSLDFKPEKNNKKYVEFGGSNKFVTFKILYKSEYFDSEQFIKIQINFVELFKYNFDDAFVNTLAKDVNIEETEFLFPEEIGVIKEKIIVKAYDLREILVEKVRAALTRKGTKVRDLVDLYFITKHLNEHLEKYEKEIIEKTEFMFKYEKYKENFLSKTFSEIDLSEVEGLLLIKIEKDFNKFVKDIFEFINKLSEKMKKKKIITLSIIF